MKYSMRSWQECSVDHVCARARVTRELARCEEALAALGDKRYLVDGDLVMQRVYRTLARRHRRRLAALQRAGRDGSETRARSATPGTVPAAASDPLA